MKKLYFLISTLLASVSLFCQVEYKIELLPDDITYRVSMRPNVTWNPPFNITSSAQVSVKAVSGSVIVSNLTALVPSTSWANNANYVNPSESPGFDYINFGLTSLGTSAFTYQAGVEVHLFTFQNSGTCAGAIDLVEAGDPFYPPNSQNANIGNQLTTLGGGAGVNVWSNNYAQGNSNCLAAPVCDVAISGVTANSPSNCGVNNGSISVTASGTAPLEFSNDNGVTWQSSNSFTGLAGGNYIIKVRNAICEVAWANNPVVLTAPSAPVISNVSATNPTGCGTDNGFIGITATGGSGSFEYSINGGGTWASSGNFANLSPGNYDVRVRNANGSCEVTGGIFNLTAPGSLTLSVSKTNPSVCNATDGSITVTASGGTGSYQFSKDGGATWQSGNVFSGLAAGSFQISARNVGGSCSTSYPTNPVVLNNPPCAPGCLIEYALERLPNGKYQVSMTPDTTWVFPQNITSSAQVTVVAPAGGFTVSNLTNLLGGVTFANNANYNAPTEDTTKKYLVFGLTTIGTTGIPYQTGVKVPLFTFENATFCTGDSLFLMPDTDTFFPPNSLNANVGQQLTTLGSGTDADICIGGSGAVCLPCAANAPDSDGDGICDAEELHENTNPNDACDPNDADTDGDGICDVQENLDGSDPQDPCDPLSTDSDQDGFCDVQEQNQGSDLHNPCDPNNTDTDGDGLCDIAENITGSDPQDPCDPNPNSPACVPPCSQLWTADTIYLTGNPGADFCLPLDFDDLAFYDVLLNDAPYSQPIQACDLDTLFFYTYAFTVGAGNAGPYLVQEWQVGSQTYSGVVADMNDLAAKMNVWNPGGNWQNNPAISAISGGLDNQNYGSIKLRHIATNVPTLIQLNLTFAPDGAKINFPAPGSYEVTLEENLSDCGDSVVVIVVDPQTETIQITTDFETPVSQICPESDDLPGNVASATLCSQPLHGTALIGNDHCVTYTPADGFYGDDQFCIVVCSDTDPVFCDTTFVTVHVGEPDCQHVFNEDTLLVHGLTADVCIPLTSSALSFFDIFLDGATVPTGSFCDSDTLTFYTYAFTFGQGGAGPYQVQSWQVGSQTFSGTVADMNDLAAKMNQWNPGGNWVNNPASFTVSGGMAGVSYGNMTLRHVMTNIPTLIQANFTLIENGVSVEVTGEGWHNIAVVSTLSGCADTLIVGLFDPDPATVTTSTPENTPTQTLCVNGNELPGSVASVSFCGSPSNGSVIFTSPNCLIYNPVQGFAGQDEFCVVVCDDNSPAFCDTTYFIVTVVPDKDTMTVVIDPVHPDTICLNPGGSASETIVSASVCGENVDEVDVTVIPGSPCIVLDPVDDFGGFTEICVVHCFEGSANGQVICDTTIIEVIVLPPTDTIEIPVDDPNPFTVCLDAVLNLPGDVVSGTLCGNNPNEVAVTIQPTGCLIIDPANGFTGTSEICVIFCDDSTPQFCDTTIIQVNVQIPCDPIFGSNDTIFTNNPKVCVPLAFSQWSLYDILLDNAPYVAPVNGCNNATLVYYTYAFVFGAGNSGPYQLTGWQVNGQNFTGTFANISALVAQMNVWDAAGNWLQNPGSLTISGGSLSNTYGQMMLKHVPTNIPTVLMPNFTDVAQGTCVNVGTPGLHQLVAVDTATGCSDTIYIFVIDVHPATVHVTTAENTASAPVCADLSELLGSPASTTICGQPQHGTVSISGTCATYTPAGGFAGEDQFCIVVCDNYSPQVCDTTFVQVTVMPNNDQVNLTIPPNDPVQICLTQYLPFQGSFTGASLCNTPSNVAVTFQGQNCLTIDPANGFAGYVDICVQHCYSGSLTGTAVCDNTIIHLFVQPTTDTVDVTVTTQDPTTICLNQYVQLPGAITSASICGDNPAEVDAVSASLNGCVILDPAAGFFETTEICVVFCSAGNPAVCDTTILLVTVDFPCPDIFPEDTIFSDAPKICIPIPLADIDLYDIILNGADYLFPAEPCNEDTLVFYTYSFTVGAGNAGPYFVNSWVVNGQTFSGLVTDMNDLAAKMNQWDATGNWLNSPGTSSISGGGTNTTYGMMILKHVATNIPALLLPNYTDVALGSCVHLESGWNEVVVVDNETGCSDTVYVFVEEAQVQVAARVFLQGAFDAQTVTMRDNLRQLDLLPQTEPYSNIASFAHTGGGGGETAAPGVFDETGTDAIVDWIFLELRSKNNPSLVLATRSALVQSDGDIVDTDGFSPVKFQVASDEYYLVVRHRNHLGAMTALPVSLTGGVTTVDFTSLSTGIFGTHAAKQIGDRRALWAGNANADRKLVFQGDVNDTDAVFFEVILAPGNSTFSPNYIFDGYHGGDTNMDGRVIFQGTDNDVDFMIFFNVLLHPLNASFLINYIFGEQLP